MFIALTRTNGQKVLINTDQIIAVRDRAGANNVLLQLANGRDVEVTEGFEDITARLAKS